MFDYRILPDVRVLALLRRFLSAAFGWHTRSAMPGLTWSLVCSEGVMMIAYGRSALFVLFIMCVHRRFPYNRMKVLKIRKSSQGDCNKVGQTLLVGHLQTYDDKSNKYWHTLVWCSGGVKFLRYSQTLGLHSLP